jgi:hypothetical protein
VHVSLGKKMKWPSNRRNATRKRNAARRRRRRGGDHSARKLSDINMLYFMDI